MANTTIQNTGASASTFDTAKTYLENGASTLYEAAATIGRAVSDFALYLGGVDISDSNNRTNDLEQGPQDNNTLNGNSSVSNNAETSNEPKQETSEQFVMPFEGVSDTQLKSLIQKQEVQFQSLDALAQKVQNKMRGLHFAEKKLNKELGNAQAEYKQLATEHSMIAEKGLHKRQQIAQIIAKGDFDLAELMAMKARQRGIERKGEKLKTRLEQLDTKIADLQDKQSNLKRGPAAIALRQGLQKALSALSE